MKNNIKIFKPNKDNYLNNLFIEELNVPNSLSDGQSVTVTARIVNDGPGPSRLFSVDFMSDNLVFDTVDIRRLYTQMRQ